MLLNSGFSMAIKSKSYFFGSLAYIIFGLIYMLFAQETELYQWGLYAIGVALVIGYGFVKHPDLFDDSVMFTKPGPGK